MNALDAPFDAKDALNGGYMYNENGNYNFETIASLDVDLLTKHINQLLNGEEVDVPSYNFISGKIFYD